MANDHVEYLVVGDGVTQPKREVAIIGTSHISAESAKLVRTVMSEFRPTDVAVELDDERVKRIHELSDNKLKDKGLFYVYTEFWRDTVRFKSLGAAILSTALRIKYLQQARMG
jgi:pheromone shutdown protein TraB